MRTDTLRTSPSQGERNALRGFGYQFRVAATVTHRSLREDSLEWVRIADPNAERVDDFQLGTQGRVDAYQIKSNRSGAAFTYKTLTNENDGKPSLIAQLASGWRILKNTNSTNRVVVHLVTDQSPSASSSAYLPLAGSQPNPGILGRFWIRFGIRHKVSDGILNRKSRRSG